jgi:hypothetical protein
VSRAVIIRKRFNGIVATTILRRVSDARSNHFRPIVLRAPIYGAAKKKITREGGVVGGKKNKNKMKTLGRTFGPSP